MPERRRGLGRVAGVAGLGLALALSLAVVVGAIIVGVRHGWIGGKRPGAGDGRAAMPLAENCSLPEVARALRTGNAQALLLVQNRIATPRGETPAALNDRQAAEWTDVLGGMRAGFSGMHGGQRMIAVGLAYRIFERFAAVPAPAGWQEALGPMHDLLSAGMADADPAVRAAALNETARAWSWLPGRSITPLEENTLAAWKQALYGPVLHCLGQGDTRTLVAAIACMGALPLDNSAAPAIAYLESKDPDVRKQILVSFARRNLLLTDDLLLRRLHDLDPTIRQTASIVLKTRGLTQEQISLGSLIFSPQPRQRLSIIPLVKDREDLDPVVWLLQLSRDTEEMVRLSAIEALAGHQTPSVRRRLAEMARSDQSKTVRQAAGKLVAPGRNAATASLPPLPGSPSLYPRAN